MSVNQQSQVSDQAVIPQWTFSDKLRKIRLGVGATQREMAQMLDVGAGAYAQWESGGSKPRHIVAIAQRLEVLSNVPAWWTLGLNAENRRPDGPNGGSGDWCTPRDLNPEPTD